MGVGVLGILTTGSRAGILALAAMSLAFLVLRRPTTPWLLAGGAIGLLAVAGGGAVAARGGRVGVRADVWAAAVDLVRENPLGVGLGRTGALLDARIPGDEAFRHAHNLWLDMLLAAGPLGLLATCGLTVVAATCVVRAARRGSAAGIALGASLAGFGALCLVDDPVNAVRNADAAWLVLGLAVGAGDAVRHRRSLEIHRGDTTSDLRTAATPVG